MEKDKHTPSLEHSRLLILERIHSLKRTITHLESIKIWHDTLSKHKQELAGHEQGLKALDNHYALLEELKHAVELIEEERGETHDTKIYKRIIKQCEG